MNQSILKMLATAALMASMIAQPTIAAETARQKPSAIEMGADLIIARPVQLLATAVGTVVFVASLPFTLLGNNVGQAGKTLVAGPAKATFARCLGCVN